MSFIKVAGAVIATAVVFTVFSAPASAARSLFAESYWRCPSGFAFETNGSAVHCKKPSYTVTKALAPCTIGLYAAMDRVGNKDMCAATNPISGEIGIERACAITDVAAGYSKRIVDGLDYCARTLPAEIQAPNMEITI